MREGILAVEIEGLDTSIFVTNIRSAVGRVDGQAKGSSREKVGVKCSTSAVVPDNASVILGCRDGDVGGAEAVAEFKGVDGGTVIREGFQRGQRQCLTRVIG